MSVILSKKIEKYKVNIEIYNSAREVVEDCKKRKITDSNFRDISKGGFNKSWEGVDSYDEALELLDKGYQPTVDKMRTLLKENISGESKRIKFENNIVGAVPIVPLAMMGVPNNMIDMKMKPIKCKVLDVYYDMTCSSGTDPEDIIKNGQKMLGAILELEKKGYKFNLYGMQTYCGDGGMDVLAVKIKSANQPLDLKRISFPLTHSAYFRVIGFDWYSKFPKGRYHWGYGCALYFEKRTKSERDAFVKKLFGNNATYICGSEILYSGQKDVEKMINNK